MAVRHLKRYASWVQNVVRQFGPYLLWFVGKLRGAVPSTRGPEWTNLWCTGCTCQGHRRVATFGRDKRWKHLSTKPTSRLIFPIDPSETMRLIGRRCTHSDVFSRAILMVDCFFYRKSFSYWRTNSVLQEKVDNTFSILLVSRSIILKRSYLGGSREVGTPDPIPNSEVKHFSADGTWTLGPGRVGRRQDTVFLIQWWVWYTQTNPQNCRSVRTLRQCFLETYS